MVQQWSISLKRNGLAEYQKTRRNLKFILVSGRSPYETAVYYIIPTLWCPGKGKSMETVISGCHGEGGSWDK